MLISVINTKMKPSTQPPEYIQYELLDKLKQALEIEMQYIDHNLTICVLPKELRSNWEYLSRAIHQVFSKNYTDLINEYRVKEAILILQNITNGTHPKMNIPEIAHQSGFKSASTFNPAFKKVMGLRLWDKCNK